MRVLINQVRQSLSSRLWAWPLVAAILAIVLGQTLTSVAVSEGSAIATFLWPGDTESANSMLSFISSTTLTVLTTTISMTLIVLQVASGNFSHQLLRDFISSRAVRGILSVYIGVFAYSIVVSRSLNTGDEMPPQLAMTLAMGGIFLAVGTFIWYVSRVVDMVRMDTVIGQSAERTITLATKLTSRAKDCDPSDVERPSVPEQAHPLRAPSFGYVKSIDLEHAASWASSSSANVVIDVRPGDLLMAGEILGWYWGADEELDEEVKMPMVVYLDSERSSGADYSLGLQRILDTAQRALSSGVNDPTTAAHAIAQGSRVLRHLAANPVLPDVRRFGGPDTNQPSGFVWSAVRSTPEFLRTFVSGLRRYINADTPTWLALLHLLESVEPQADAELRDVIEAERTRILATASKHVTDTFDLESIREAATPPTLWDADSRHDGTSTQREGT